IENDPILGLEAVENFEAGAEIAADGERLQARTVIRANDHGAESFRAEEQRVHGNLQALRRDFYLKIDLRIAAGEQLRGFVGDVHFGEERSGGKIDGFGGAHDLALEFLTGELREYEIGADAGVDGSGISFGNVDVNADRIGLRQEEELLRGAAIACIDEHTNVGVAARDDAAKGSFHALEGFQLFEAANIGFGGLNDSTFGGLVADGIVHFLFGDAVSLQEFGVTGRGDIGEVHISLSGVQIGAGLR